MAEDGRNDSISSLELNWKVFTGLAVVTTIYFADIFLKASQKCFWFDELFTVYLCRLPNFKATWSAVAHGADFNPPLFYLLTRGTQAVFGEGLISTRLPAMIGVWAFCVCLFFFVGKRCGVLSGFVAGAFPFFTLAQYYAYEARAHGIVLGWCGLALICWQQNSEGRGKYLSLSCFTLSITCALLTHVYAVFLLIPFAIAEFDCFWSKRRPNWAIVSVLAFTLGAVALTVYIPLSRLYRAMIPTTFFPASHDLLQRFLVAAVGPAMVIVLLLLLFIVLGGMRDPDELGTVGVPPRREIVIAVGFICIPLVGLIGSKLTHGPFFDRYFLSSIAGYAILLGFASGSRRSRPWVPACLACVMFVLMVSDTCTVAYLAKKNRIMLFEPSTGLRLTTTPKEPMQLYGTLSGQTSNLDILVLPSLEYLYFFRYAPSTLVPHLYYGSNADDVNLGGFERLAKTVHIDLQTTTFDRFLSTHSRFLIYETGNGAQLEAAQAIANAGYSLKGAQGDVSGIMYEYSK